MSAADCKSSRRKMIARYGKAPSFRKSVGEAIAEERARAARQAAAKKKK